jgi:pimeloyl-ACP methyl ester carboxylesterase
MVLVRIDSVRHNTENQPPAFLPGQVAKYVSPRWEAASKSASKINNVIVATPSARISCFEAGVDSDLPALVLLPGLCCSAQQLLTAVLPLAEKTKLVAVDWRGHGKSSAPRDCSIKDLAQDVMAVIRQRLQGSRLVVMGHSMGVRVMWHMWGAFKHELVAVLDGVAVIDQTPSPSTGKTSNGATDHAHAMFKKDSQEIRLGKQQMVAVFERLWGAADSGFANSRSEFSDWLQFASQCNPTAVCSLHWDAVTSDYTHVMQSLNKRTLIMVGDSTLAANSISQRYAAAIPPQGAHFALFPGGRHCLHRQPEQLPKLNSLVEQLLDGSLDLNSSPGCLGGSIQRLSMSVLADRTHNLNHKVNNTVLQKQAAPLVVDYSIPIHSLNSFAPPKSYLPAVASVSAYSRMPQSARLRV